MRSVGNCAATVWPVPWYLRILWLFLVGHFVWLVAASRSRGWALVLRRSRMTRYAKRG